MKNAGSCAALLLVLPIVFLAASPAAEPGNATFKEEISKQESIYRSAGEQTTEGYTVNRALPVYADALPSGFDGALARLGPTDRWLDIGAGEGQAILDYYTPGYDLTHPQGREQRGAKAQAVAMSIEDRRTPRWNQTAARLEPNKIQYLFEKRLREYSPEELGQFQIITDVIGGFSYTANISDFMERVLGLLQLNGTFFTALQDVQWEDGKNQPHYAGARFLTEIENPDGSPMKMCTWLKRIVCAEVTCETKPEWQPPLESFRIRKTCNKVQVPPLTPVHYQAGTPPERRFKLAN